MNRVKFVAFVILFALASIKLAVAENVQEQRPKESYPPVFFYSPVEAELLIQLVRESNAFEAVDNDIMGRPIGIRVFLSRDHQASAGRTGSALLAITTLGLTPLTQKFNFEVEVVLLAHDTLIYKQLYSLPRKETQNLWAMKDESELRPDEKEFIRESIDKFIDELEQSKKAQDLFAEYRMYFD